MRRWGLLDILIGFLSLVVLVILVVVVFFLSFPSAGKTTVEALRVEFGIKAGYDFQDILDNSTAKIKGRASDGYELRIRPFFVNGYEIAISPFAKDKEEVKAEMAIEEVRECLACHRTKIVRRSALNHIYMDHKVHLAKGIYCKSCHPGVKQPEAGKEIVVQSLKREFESLDGNITHGNYIKDTSVFRPASDRGLVDPSGEVKEVVSIKQTHVQKPETIGEDLCVKCHKKDKKAPVTCAGCHPPGSVFAEGVYDDKDSDEFFGGGHISIPLPAGFEHGRSSVCEQCHTGKKYCQKCHKESRKHPNNWLTLHPVELGVIPPKDPNYFKGRSRLTLNYCNACHMRSWCSTTCHPNQDQERINRGKIVPLRKLEYYLNF